MPRQIVVLGTGGTIAGSAAAPADHVGYTAGQLGVDHLLAALPELAGLALQVEQLAQLDSKDMDFATWRRLAGRTQQLLDDDGVAGIVITHGTDTLEETAYLLHRVLKMDRPKPVVLTAAMRPASSRSPDGPQNLLDAVLLAVSAGVHGVLVAVNGAVHRGDRLRKTSSYRVDAFASEGGPIAWVENGQLRPLSTWPLPDALGLARLQAEVWPRVELLCSAAGVDGAIVPLLQQLAAQEGRHLGLVVAGTGNGTLAGPLEAALLTAMAQGVAVLRSTRCASGPVIGGALPSAGALSPPQARVELLLQLLDPEGRIA